MSFNGSGVFQINTSGQPVVAGTAISDTVFNDLTADLASGLSTCMTKDGQQTATANIPMGGFKFTGMGLGLATTDSARMDNATCQNVCEGRLGSDTPNSGGGFRTADNSTTVSYYPYKGNKIALYNSTQWVLRSFTTKTISVPATTSQMYDVFAYDNAGVVTMETVAWTSDTARATGLTTQDGVLVKSGDATRRYIGSFRTGTVSGQTRDSDAFRYIWNYYNRVPIKMIKTVTSATSWNYTTAVFRQANGDTANQIDFVYGVAEDPVSIEVVTSVRNTNIQIIAQTGIGLRSTTTDSATIAPVFIPAVANIQTVNTVKYFDIPGTVGRINAVWLEKSIATGTATWNDIGNGSISGWYMG